MNDVVQLLVFSLDERRYALRLDQVERVVYAVDSVPLPGAPDAVMGVIDLHGQLIPLFDIHKRFGLAQHDVRTEDHFVIARSSRRVIALIADQVMDVIERAMDEVVSVDPIVPGLEAIDGVIHLKDGLVLIHNLDRFLTTDEDHNLQQCLTGREQS